MGKKHFPAIVIGFMLLLMVMLSACSSIALSPSPDPSPNTEAALNTETPQVPLELTQETKVPSQEMIYLRGINLGNALEAPPEEDWCVTIQEAYFQVIREAGFNAVRIPVRFSDYTGPGPDYLIQEDFFAVVDETVQWGLDNDLIVILDLHHFNAFKQDPEGERDRFLAIWEQISLRYRDMPPELFFELLSEPSTNITASFWNDALGDVIAIIRETNPTRKIVVDGIDYADIAALGLLALPDDDNLIATIHYYEPFEFTHQGASWVSGSDAWLGTTWEGTSDERDAVTQAFDGVYEWSILHEIPVIIGEFGVSDIVDPASRQAWFQFVTQEAETRGIGWVLWQFCSDFGVYDCSLGVWDETILDVLTNPQ